MSKELAGKVISKKSKLTANVLVVLHRLNKFLGRVEKIRSKYLVHDPFDKCQIGDNVIIKSCRPISCRKSFAIKEIIK
jgi:small subunit ribosomal protein S17